MQRTVHEHEVAGAGVTDGSSDLAPLRPLPERVDRTRELGQALRFRATELGERDAREPRPPLGRPRERPAAAARRPPSCSPPANRTRAARNAATWNERPSATVHDPPSTAQTIPGSIVATGDSSNASGCPGTTSASSRPS